MIDVFGTADDPDTPGSDLDHVTDEFGDPSKVTVYDPAVCGEGEAWITIDARHALTGARGDFA